MLAFLLVLFVTMPDGEVERFVMDSQLSYEDCALSGASIEPLQATASWVCVPDILPQEPQPFSLLVDVAVDYE